MLTSINFFLIAVFLIACYFLLTIKEGNRFSNKFMALLFILVVIQAVGIELFRTEVILNVPYLAEFNIPFLYLIPPAYYFYIKSLFHYKLKFKRRNFVHIIPFLTTVAFLIPFYSSDIETKQNWLINAFNEFPPIKYVFTGLFLTQFFIYTYLCLKYLRRITLKIEESTGLPPNLKKWIRDLSYLSMFYLFIVSVPLIIDNSEETYAFFPMLNFVMFLIFLYRIFFLSDILLQLQSVNDIIADSEKYKASNISESDMTDILRMIDEYLVTNRVYQDPELSLTLLANKMQIPVNHVS
ncbi:hypothetical protein ACFLQ9_00430, partial [Bacteroidota bacterium]